MRKIQGVELCASIENPANFAAAASRAGARTRRAPWVAPPVTLNARTYTSSAGTLASAVASVAFAV